MIPQAVLDALPAPLSLIGDAAEFAAGLSTAFRKYSNPLDFINTYMKGQPASYRSVLGMVYRIAKYFHNQGDYLSMIPSDLPLDRRLAGVSLVPADQYDPTRPYRYEVVINAYSPGAKVNIDFNVYVPSKYLLTSEGAIEQALDTLRERLESKYKIKVTESAIDDWRTSASVVKFTRFMLGP
jgi:hypothetical protein